MKIKKEVEEPIKYLEEGGSSGCHYLDGAMIIAHKLYTVGRINPHDLNQIKTKFCAGVHMGSDIAKRYGKKTFNEVIKLWYIYDEFLYGPGERIKWQ